ncbi:hypothetical protein [Dysgonomonas sp. 520]|nr:hypothetical protein [Dysgonomonas sp. 520]
MKKIELIPKIMEFVDKIGDTLKVVQAFLKGFETFQNELKGDNNNGSEK